MTTTENTFQHNINLQWKGGQYAELSCLPIQLPLSINTTTNLEKGMIDSWSPDYLFVAAVESCFLTTFLTVAKHGALNYLSFECSALGCFGMINQLVLVSDIILKPVVTVSHPHDIPKAFHILNSTAEKSKIMHSVKTRVHVIPKVITQARETKANLFQE